MKARLTNGTFNFTRYLWITGVSGRAGIGDLSDHIDSSIRDDNVKLNAGY